MPQIARDLLSAVTRLNQKYQTAENTSREERLTQLEAHRREIKKIIDDTSKIITTNRPKNQAARGTGETSGSISVPLLSYMHLTEQIDELRLELLVDANRPKGNV